MIQTSAGGLRWRVDGALSALSSPRGFAAAVIFYLAALYFLRISLFPGASEDDAETLFLSQSFEGGYKIGQPPLYIWLAYGLTYISGPVLPVVVALKFICLGFIYFLTHRLAHLVTGNGRCAAVAGLSVLGIYYLSWDAVLNYSQTVLLATLALAFSHALVRLGVKISPGIRDYIWFGGLIGAGVLTKYNFAVLAVSLLAAAMADHDLRGKLLNIRGLLSAIIAAGMLFPHGVWLLSGDQMAAPMAAAVPATDSVVLSRLDGLLDMVVAIISVLSPLLILYILFFPRAFWRITGTDENHRRWRKLCERCFWFLLMTMAAMVLVTGLTEVRNHWFIILAPFPAYAVLRIADAYPSVQTGQRPSTRISGFVCLLVVLGIIVGAGLTARALTQSTTCSKCKMVVPYDQLADGLRDAGFTGGTVYVHDYPTQVGGNLRRFFPDSRFVSYKFRSYTPPVRTALPGQCLAVWLLGAGGQSPTPNAVLRQLKDRLGVTTSPDDLMQTIHVALPGRPEPLSYGYILINDLSRQGTCR